MEWFKEFLQDLIYVGSDGEHTEIQKTFFAILGNLFIIVALYITYILSTNGFSKLFFWGLIILNCFPFAKYVVKFSELKNSED